jgi:hypothetical protein
MGLSALMSVVNNSSRTITVSVADQTCMYSNGDEHSHLDDFNNLVIKAGETYPHSGGGRNIQADSSGTCSFSNSSFRLDFLQKDDKKYVQFEDHSTRTWESFGQPEWISPSINNDGKKATIVITVTNY